MADDAWPENVDGEAIAAALSGETRFEVRYHAFSSGAHL